MPKVDDTNQVPDKLSAPWLKRFFKRKFGVTVRVSTMSGRAGYIDVWIPSKSSNKHELEYDRLFPPALGNRCVQVVYPKSETLRTQNWGGNIRSHNIAMTAPQWRFVLRTLIEEPIQLEDV